MPKDLMHFTIAEQTAKRLTDTRFAPCLKSEPDGLLLGSIFHDALFYAVMPASRPLESLAHRFHGAQGQDTYTLIRMQADHAAHAPHKDLACAVLVGMVSHLFADVVMHPLVWYLTGQYYAEEPTARSSARQHHRTLESLMDMVVCSKMIGHPRYVIRAMRTRCPDFLTKGLPLGPLGALADMSAVDTCSQLNSAWRIYTLLQSAFSIQTLARTLFAMRPYLPSSAKEIIALFYAPQLMRQAEFLRGTIPYQHPVSGEDLQATLNDLIVTAADMAASLCHQLEPTLFDNIPVNLPGIGPSMDAGLAGIPAKKLLHFAKKPFPNLP